MSKIYTDKNVLEAALERLEIIFNNFDNIYFSVSGGKDSSVMVQLANRVAQKLNKKFDVLYIDLEAQYKYTIEHVEELKTLSQIRDFYHIALPIALRNAVSVLQPKWICWEEESKHLWVRNMPKDAINIDNCPFPWFKKGEEFEEFIIQFADWYQKKYKGKIPCQCSHAEHQPAVYADDGHRLFILCAYRHPFDGQYADGPELAGGYLYLGRIFGS